MSLLESVRVDCTMADRGWHVRITPSTSGAIHRPAGIHAALGDIAAACAALQRALADHSQLLGFLGSDPAMDALKGETCYREALRRLSVSPSVHP